MSEALWPPKPKLLDITTESFRCAGLVGRVVQVAVGSGVS